jgi:uncharacterized protein involved in exopolysaccharide biosynthesis
MTRHTQSTITPADVLRILKTHRLHWIVPFVAVTLLAGCYAVVRPRTWEASQALVIRNEAAGDSERPGHFKQPEEMKVTQETLLEIVKSRGVLEAALREVGPTEASAYVPSWPTNSDVEDLRKAIQLTAPNGAEFGRTEIFYLTVKDHDRLRAVTLAETICGQLELRFQQLRSQSASSVIDELNRNVELSQKNLDTATKELGHFEQGIGNDLAELRMLHLSPSGSSELRENVKNLETALRKGKEQIRMNHELASQLEAASHDPRRLMAAPARLLESQPALLQLKQGLVEAQLRTAQLEGARTESHPLVRDAKSAEAKIRQHLHDEVTIALRGIQAEMQLAQAQVSATEQELVATDARLTGLAGQRAEYSRMVAQVEHHTRLLQDAETQLSDARAVQMGADSASLLTRLDRPSTGDNPVGPGRTMIVLAGMVGGLFLGGGVLLLTVQPGTVLANERVSYLAHGSDWEKSTPDASATDGVSLNGAQLNREEMPLWDSNG